jgi:hypothetical protein
MGFSGTNLIMDEMTENAKGGSRKAPQAVAIRDSMAKKGNIGVRCNLIQPETANSNRIILALRFSAVPMCEKRLIKMQAELSRAHSAVVPQEF